MLLGTVKSAKPAESLQADISKKVIETAKKTDVQMSKEVNTKEAEDVLNKNKGADDEMALAKEVNNIETSLCLHLDDIIVLPESANPPDDENIQEDLANKIPEADVFKETDDQVSQVSQGQVSPILNPTFLATINVFCIILFENGTPCVLGGKHFTSTY